MPAETHQLGRHVDAEGIAELLISLLERDTPLSADVTLAECGLGDDDVHWLWEAVCEEFSERTLSPELGAGALLPGMTIGRAAAVMAGMLADGGDDGGC